MEREKGIEEEKGRGRGEEEARRSTSPAQRKTRSGFLGGGVFGFLEREREGKMCGEYY